MNDYIQGILLLMVTIAAFCMPNRPDTVQISDRYGDMKSIDLIQPIVCGDKLGTASLIDAHRAVTAAHVTGLNARCSIHGHHAKVIYSNVVLDVAIVEVENSVGWNLSVNCGGLIEGEKYYAVGYILGQKYLAIEPLIATSHFARKSAEPPKTSAGLPRIFDGRLHSGMSGGPILNEHGEMVAISLAKATIMESNLGLGIDVNDTNLCHDGKLQ